MHFGEMFPCHSILKHDTNSLTMLNKILNIRDVMDVLACVPAAVIRVVLDTAEELVKTVVMVAVLTVVVVTVLVVARYPAQIAAMVVQVHANRHAMVHAVDLANTVAIIWRKGDIAVWGVPPSNNT